MSARDALYQRYLNEANQFAVEFGLDPAGAHNGAWNGFRHA